MKGFKKKNLFIQLLMVLMVIALVGCGGTAPNQEAQEPGNEEGVPAADLIVKGMSVDGFSYDYVITTPDGEKLTHKMWVKGGNLRSEMENPMGGEPILTIINADEGLMYVYNPETKYAIQTPMQQSDIQSPKDYLSETDSEGMVFISREIYDKKDCLVYETNEDGMKGKMWIWEEGGMPLRVESTKDGETVVAEFLNFNIGDVDNSMFSLPAGAQIMDMSNYQ